MKRVLSFAIVAFVAAASAPVVAEEAMPLCVWADSSSEKGDRSISFRSSFDYDGAGDVVLKVSASAVYRVCLNGEFAGWGPARAVYGFARVDRWPLVARKGRNILTIEVAGYRFESFQYSGANPFLSASVEAGGRRLVETPDGFEAVEVPRKVSGPVYSRQRGFVAESYEVGDDWKRWSNGDVPDRNWVNLQGVQSPRWLERRVPYPDFSVNDGFRTKKDAKEQDIFCLPSIDSGFVGLDVLCVKPGRIVIEFDEALGTNGVIDLSRNGNPLKSWHATYNRLAWDVKDAGRYKLETIEPYSLKLVMQLSQPHTISCVRPV